MAIQLVPPPDDRPWGCDDDGGGGSGVVPVAPNRMPLLERAERLQARFPLERLPTGLPTLDEACRGGLTLPRFVVVGGAPGAGKTSLVVWWALQWARAGRRVFMLAVDEGADDILMRLAAEQGHDVGKLEEGGGEEWGRFKDYLRELWLEVLDGDDGWTVEAVAAIAAEQPGSILIVDSIQTANVLAEVPDPTPRQRIEAVIGVCKRLVKQHRILLVATSELARAAYRNRAQAENIDPLAAFAESRATEYGAQTALVLRSLPDGDGLVEVCVPKNRGGIRPTFQIAIDSRTRITEHAAEEDAGEEARYEALRREVRDAIRKGGMSSANAVYHRVGKRKQDVFALVREEVEAGRVVRVDGELRISSV